MIAWDSLKKRIRQHEVHEKLDRNAMFENCYERPNRNQNSHLKMNTTQANAQTCVLKEESSSCLTGSASRITCQIQLELAHFRASLYGAVRHIGRRRQFQFRIEVVVFVRHPLKSIQKDI